MKYISPHDMLFEKISIQEKGWLAVLASLDVLGSTLTFQTQPFQAVHPMDSIPNCPGLVRGCLPAALQKHRFKHTKVFVTVPCLLAFLYNVYCNVCEYQLQQMVVEVSKVDQPPAEFPPLILCPYPFLDPLRLVELGLNVSVKTAEELEYNIDNLVGIDENLSGRQLLDVASWRLQEIVTEVRIDGEIIDKHFSPKINYRYFTPIGPCLRFVPPVNSLKGLQLSIKLSFDLSCTGVKRMCDAENVASSSASQKLCSVTSLWCELAKTYWLMLVMILPSTYPSFDLYKTGLGTRIISSKYSYELVPFEVVSDSSQDIDYNPWDCLSQTYARNTKGKDQCKDLVNSSSLVLPLKRLCVTRDQSSLSFLNFFEVEHNDSLRYSCKPKTTERRWKLGEDILPLNGSSDTVILKLSSSSLTRFYGRYRYPLSKLFENIGGSLGLFLGISLLDIWLRAGNILEHVTVTLRYFKKDYFNTLIRRFSIMKHISRLCLLTGIIFFAVPFLVHLIILVNIYTNGSHYTSVTMKLFTFDSKKVDSRGFLVETLPLYLASRPLGCQFMSMTRAQKCLFSCFLPNTSSFPLSSLSVDDLPQCQHNHVTLPKMKYSIQSSILESLSNSSELLSCQSRCQLENASQIEGSNIFLVTEEESSTFLSFICGLGGIIGLYFGFSAGQLKNIAEKYFHWSRVAKRQVTFVWHCLTLFLCSLLFVCPVEKYLFSHPIHSESSIQALTKDKYPTVTMCLWPPFNVSKLLSSVGLQSSYNEVMLLDPKGRFNALTYLIQHIDKVNGSDELHPDDLWGKSAWDVETFVFQKNLKRIFKKSSLFNKCLTLYNFDARFSAIFPALNVNFGLKQYFFSQNPGMTVLLFFHGQDDFPLMTKDIVPLSNAALLVVDDVEEWTGVHGKNISFGECLSLCADRILVSQYKCNFPWTNLHQDIQPCNMTHFAAFLTILWTHVPNNGSLYEALIDSASLAECYEQCQTNWGIFYEVAINSGGTKVGRELSFSLQPCDAEGGFNYFELTVSVTTSSFKKITHSDGYTVSQFTSELGGIVGMILGTSLLSLLVKTVK